RSWNMSRIRGKDTKPELLVRSALHAMGYRFRVHCRTLPGCPDLVLPKHRLIILVHGCFWHRHRNCQFAYTPKSRRAFWGRKFARNLERDAEVRRMLRRLGWRVIVIWECQTASDTMLNRFLNAALRQTSAVSKDGS